MSRKRRRKPRKKQGVHSNPPAPSPGRRRFLKKALIGSAVVGSVAATGAGIFYLIGGEDQAPVQAPVQETIPNPSGIDWEILERREALRISSLDDLMRHCAVLGPRTTSKRKRTALSLGKSLDPKAKRALESKGYDLGALYNIEKTNLHFGYPESKHATEEAFKYCKAANEYIHSNLKGIRDFKFRWTPLKAGDNFSRDYDRRVYIGRRLYVPQSFKVTTLEKTPQMTLTWSVTESNEGGKGIYGAMPDPEDDFFYVYVSTGDSLLRAPFSEFIPLSAIRKRNEYELKVGDVKAAQSIEALSEAMSTILARGFSRKLKIPNGEETVDRLHKLLEEESELYKYVKPAIRWMEKHGIQAGWDLYMDDPAKFMKAIERYE